MNTTHPEKNFQHLWLAVAPLLALFLWTYWPIIPGLIAQWWNEPDYSHGFLIPFISLGFVWFRRNQLASIEVQPGYGGLLMMSMALMLYVAGHIGADMFLQRISLILMLSGILVFMAGWSMFKALLFPLGYLLLAVPLPGIIFNSIAFPLQLLAARIATNTMHLLSVPVLREGNIMHLASVSLDVEEACSGIRSLFSLLAIGVLYAQVTTKKLTPRLVIALAVIPIAIAANVFRVTTTGFLAHYLSVETAMGFFHQLGGMVVFAVALLLFFCISQLVALLGPKQ